MRFEAGTEFADYLIVLRLGRGGMATVYLAREPNIDRLVALKVLPEQLVDEADFAQRFAREARLIGALDHPNIVPLYRYGITGDIPWMALRYVDGGDLGARLARETMPATEGLAVLRSVAAALDYAHGKGIIHRDLKPQNILLSQDGAAYLADFGVAKILEGNSGNKTITGGILGTPAYMAPEQAQGLQLGPFTDVYALAVIAFQWLVGILPFDADTPQAILMKHALEPVPCLGLQRLAPPVAAAIARGLAKRPQDRFASAGALVAELEQALLESTPSRTETVRATQIIGGASAVVAASNPATRKRLLSRMLLALGALAVIIGIALLVYWDDANQVPAKSASHAVVTPPNSIVTQASPNASPLGASESQVPVAPIAHSEASRERDPESAKVPPSPVVNRPTEATLLIEADLSCDLVVNGKSRGSLSPGKSITVKVMPGEQLIECADSAHADVRARLTKTILAGEQGIAVITMRDKIAQTPIASSPLKAADGKASSFVKSNKGTVEDRGHNTTWAESDNGADIDAEGARVYCASLGSRWRVPSITELETLYNPEEVAPAVCAERGAVSYTCKISPLFHLTSLAFWSDSGEETARATQFNLFSGHREIVPAHSSSMARVLCVHDR